MFKYDVVADGIIKEGEYKAEFNLKETSQSIAESHGKRGFSRKSGFMARDIRLAKEQYGDALRATHSAALDKVEQLKLAEYQSQQSLEFIDLKHFYDIQKIQIRNDADHIKLADDTLTKTTIQQLNADKQRDVSIIDLDYTFTAREISIRGGSEQALERSNQGVLTELAVSDIRLDSDKAIQNIELYSTVKSKEIQFTYDKQAKQKRIDANIEASINQSDATNKAAENESESSIDAALLKNDSQLESVTKEGQARVINTRDISQARNIIAKTSGDLRLQSSQAIHDSRIIDLQADNDARVINLSDENDASIDNSINLSNARLEESASDREVRLEVISNENDSKLSNIRRKYLSDSTSRQSVLSSGLENSINENSERLSAIQSINSSEIQARILRNASSQQRANTREVVINESSLIRNDSKIFRLNKRISDQTINRFNIDNAELSSLIGEFNSQLTKVNILGDSKLLTSSIIDNAKINNDIAISRASIETQKEISIATTNAKELSLRASSQSSGVRLEGSANSKSITEASNANIQASRSYTTNNIDFLNSWSDAYIAVNNNVQTVVEYITES